LPRKVKSLTPRGPGCPLLLDERLEGGGGSVHDTRIGVGPLEDDHAGAVEQRAHEVRLHLAAVGRGARPTAVVDEDVLFGAFRVRVVAGVGGAPDQGAELGEVAVLLGRPGPRARGGEGHAESFRSAFVSASLGARTPSYNPQRPLKNPSRNRSHGTPLHDP
jgi:hypothetical protein